jgi:hypothetical protein
MLGPVAVAQTPLTAAEIMARVAANQDRSDQLRREYVYQQHVHVVSRLSNGKLKREETADYEVFPVPDGSQNQLQSLTGRYLQKGKYVDYRGKPEGDDDSIDQDLVGDFREDLVNEKSRDGLARNLFPLTTDQQNQYEFRLLGEAQQDGRSAYRIGFRPRANKEASWSGEAFIDKEEFQPVLVFTKLHRKIPLAVRTLLGTDVPGVGFSVHYRRQPDGVWFPVSFGTEFRLRALFMIKRDISMSLENRNFERTHVDTKIKVLGPE